VTFARIIRAYLLLMLRGYKALISPMLPNACRFVPTCSEYAAEAVDRYGAVRGGCMALWRLLRCNPFSSGGYDPVILPENHAGTPECVCQSRDVSTGTVEKIRPEVLHQPVSSHILRPDVRRC
jgi:putative membrane protein insertion efficiency factor